MKTERLYEQDSHLFSFDAQVISCIPDGGEWLVTLDRTTFFPEGGGQPCDLGTLGGAKVLDVQLADGNAVHRVDAPLEEGSTVRGELDIARRLDLTQQHSGEHIVSGLVHSRFGYDNVGFHLGADVVTVDWNGPITREELSELELEANRLVRENAETEVFIPSPEELAKIDYRSKKELEGDVRIVRFPGADTCACCGTHVKRAGEIGLILLLSCKKFRDGVRVEMVSGERALNYARTVAEQNRTISVLLSAHESETASHVAQLKEENERLKYRLAGMEQNRCALLAEHYAGKGDCLLIEDGLDSNELRRLCDAVAERCGGRCAMFSGENGNYRYCIGEPGGDLRQFVKKMNTALNGRGGGKPFFVQGAVQTDRKAIEAFFESEG